VGKGQFVSVIDVNVLLVVQAGGCQPATAKQVSPCDFCGRQIGAVNVSLFSSVFPCQFYLTIAL
jgi:hypothetical protein